jgi:hypothetical protein
VRVIAARAFALMLAACQSSQRAAEQAAADQSTDCLVRESQVVAPQPIDLETAALAVLARCDYPGVLERKWVAQFPTERAFIREQVQKQYADILDTTKRGIALLRAGAAQRQAAGK